MRFQFGPKLLHAGPLAHAQRQPVQQQGIRKREGCLAGSGAHSGLTEEQSTTGAKRAGRTVSRQLATQILWSFVMKAFVCQQEDLKLDPLFNGKPVQLGKHRGAASQDNSGAGILHAL